MDETQDETESLRLGPGLSEAFFGFLTNQGLSSPPHGGCAKVDEQSSLAMKRLVPFACGLLIVSLASATPSHAAPADCTPSIGTGYLLGLGTTGCKIGDKVYSDFSFTGAWKSSSVFSFTNSPASEHTFSAAGLGLTAGTYSYQYTVSILGPNKFLSYKTDLQSSASGTINAKKELKGTPDGVNLTVNYGTTPGSYTYPTPTSGPVTFVGKLTVTSGRIDGITDNIVQSQIDGVPGPLPLLGAGVAFGLSRRVRQRIKQTA